MNDRLAKAEALFHEALELPPEQREGFLQQACGEDVELRREVAALLRASGVAERWLKETEGGDIREGPGTVIGRYKLREKVGEGGCGVVYVAEQEEPVRRRVALKVIKLGMDTKSVIARFEAERQALAIMDHPNIAKVLDAGATETGRPYFVMELVRGIRITDYCDQHKLSTGERLDLFIKVCQAVQHAHQKGIIHRDIKPSNILVTLHDGVPVPKIIDFGIAKATEGRLTDLTVYTELNQFIGTPAYMSPEQAEMSGLDIDTRSDIYSLGVLLYELLTGQPPFDPRELIRRGIDEIRRTIREVEPPRPSTRLSTLAAASLSDVAHRRHTEAPKLLSLIRGDLDWIVMKCLEKDRTRRYETTNGLAMDIQRHLGNEPILACPPSAGYQLRKFARRNKTALGLAGAIGAILVVATAASMWQAIRATRERDEKEKAREEAEAISTFFTEVFQSPDPARDGRTITVAETLDRAARKLDPDLASQPARRAKLQTTLASTYHALGLYRDAIPLLERARNYYLATLGPEHAVTLRAMHNLANSYFGAARREEALKLREEVLALSRKVLGPEHLRTLSAMHNLAISYSDAGRRDEALKQREEVLALCRRVLGPEHQNTLSAMHVLAISYFDAGRWEEALKLKEEVLRLRRNVLGLKHPDTLRAMQNVAVSYSHAGHREEALKLREEVLALSLKINGPEHPDTLTAMDYLAISYFDAGRREEALKLREELLPLRRKVDGPEHPNSLLAMNNLAISYRDAGRREEALKLREEVLALDRKVLGPEHPTTLAAMHNLAISYFDAGRRAEALKLREEVLPLRRKVSGLEHPDTLPMMRKLAESYSDAGMPNQALPLIEDLFKIQRGLDDLGGVFQTMDLITRAYQATGSPDSAEAFYREQLAQHGSGLASLGLGRLLLEGAKSDTENPNRAQERAREGERLVREYLATVRGAYTNQPAKLQRSIHEVAELRYRQSNYPAAEPLYREIVQSGRARLGAEAETVLEDTSSLARLLADWAWAERDPKSEIRNPKSEIVERAREAEALLRECLAIRLRSTNSTHWRTGDVKSRLGAALVSLAVIDPALNADARQAKLAEAETLLLQGNERLQRSRSAEAKYKRDSLERLVRLYQAWDKPEKLSEWQQKLEAFKAAETKSSKPAEEERQ